MGRSWEEGRTWKEGNVGERGTVGVKGEKRKRHRRGKGMEGERGTV